MCLFIFLQCVFQALQPYELRQRIPCDAAYRVRAIRVGRGPSDKRLTSDLHLIGRIRQDVQIGA